MKKSVRVQVGRHTRCLRTHNKLWKQLDTLRKYQVAQSWKQKSRKASFIFYLLSWWCQQGEFRNETIWHDMLRQSFFTKDHLLRNKMGNVCMRAERKHWFSGQWWGICMKTPTIDRRVRFSQKLPNQLPTTNCEFTTGTRINILSADGLTRPWICVCQSQNLNFCSVLHHLRRLGRQVPDITKNHAHIILPQAFFVYLRHQRRKSGADLIFSSPGKNDW